MNLNESACDFMLKGERRKIVPELLIRKVKVENARNALRNVVCSGGMYDGLIQIHNKGQLPSL